MENNSTMLPQLKANTIVTVQLGSAFIAKIQECFQIHIADHQEDLQKLQERNGDYDSTPLTPWENQALMYSSLLQEIMKTAEKAGFIEYVSMESLLKDIAPNPNDQMGDSDQH